jgi:hypothetical protein
VDVPLAGKIFEEPSKSVDFVTIFKLNFKVFFWCAQGEFWGGDLGGELLSSIILEKMMRKSWRIF